MAARARRASSRSKTVHISVDGDGGGDSSGGEQPQNATDAVVQEQAEVGSATKPPQAIIRRVDPTTGREAYLDQVALSIVDEEWVAQTYGGGKYRVHKMGVRDEGKWGFIGQDTYEIDDSLPFKGSMKSQSAERRRFVPPMLDDPAPIYERDGSPAGGGMDSIMQTGVLSLFKSQQDASMTQQQAITQIMAAANSQQTMMQQAMLGIMEQMRESSKSRVDFPAIIAAAAPIVTALIGLIANKKSGSELEMLLPLLEKMRAPQPSEKMEDMLKMVRELKETAEVFNGGESGGSDLMKMAGPLLAAFAPMLMQPAPTGTAPVAARPAPTVAAAMSEMPLVESGVPTSPMDVLAPYMSKLILAARMNRRPAVIAGMVEDFAPEEQKGTIRELLADPQLEEKLVARFPEVAQYPTWMTELLFELRIAFIGEDADGGDGSDDEEEVSPTAKERE